jgi:WD40 repeat protein
MRPSHVQMSLTSPRNQCLLRLQECNDSVCDLCFSPNSLHLVAAGSDGDNTVRVWNIEVGLEIATYLPPSKSLVMVEFYSDSVILLCERSHHLKSVVKMWEFEAGSVVDVHTFESEVTAVCWSADRTQIGTATYTQDQHAVHVWQYLDGEVSEVAALNGHQKHITTVSFSPQGDHLASASHDNTVRIWQKKQDAKTFSRWWEICEILDCGTGSCKSVSWSHDGNTFALCADDDVLVFWSTHFWVSMLKIKTKTWFIESLQFTTDDHHIVSASTDGYVRIWRCKDGMEVCCMSDHMYEAEHVACSGDGQYIASVGMEGTVVLWSAPGWTKGIDGAAEPEPVIEKVECFPNVPFCWSPDGVYLAVGASPDEDAGGIELHEIDAWTATLHRSLKTAPGKLWAETLQWSADGRYVAAHMGGGEVRVWGAQEGGDCGSACSLWAGEAECISFSPCSQQVVVVLAGGAVQLWSARTGEHAVTVGQHRLQEDEDDEEEEETGQCSCCFSPSGLLIASCVRESVHIWDVASLSCLKVTTGHGAQFSCDSAHLVAIDYNNIVVCGPLDGPADQIESVEISPTTYNWTFACYVCNGQYIIAYADMTIALFSVLPPFDMRVLMLSSPAVVQSLAVHEGAGGGLRVAYHAESEGVTIWELCRRRRTTEDGWMGAKVMPLLR